MDSLPMGHVYYNTYCSTYFKISEATDVTNRFKNLPRSS